MPPVRSLRKSTRAARVRPARTCYDDLAGRLGADLLSVFVEARWISRADAAAACESSMQDAGNPATTCVPTLKRPTRKPRGRIRARCST